MSKLSKNSDQIKKIYRSIYESFKKFNFFKLIINFLFLHNFMGSGYSQEEIQPTPAQARQNPPAQISQPPPVNQNQSPDQN